MKVSVSLPGDDIEFLDGYVREQRLGSRSAAVHRAVGLLRAAELAETYAAAWEEWRASGDSEAWESTAGDGISPDAPR
jgi:Arc/MetJ-type ribon-helix-helix transcriptional regulator